jgi:hypothetical protein
MLISLPFKRPPNAGIAKQSGLCGHIGELPSRT